MKVAEILGDSVREDLNFVADKIKDLPIGKTVYFVGENLETITRIKEAPAFSKIEIDTENEARYKIYFQKIKNSDKNSEKFTKTLKNNSENEKSLKKNPEIYFILSKNLEKFQNLDYIFLIDLTKFEKAKKLAKEKVFLLTARGKEDKNLEEIRENKKDLEIIQLGLPESWIEF